MLHGNDNNNAEVIPSSLLGSDLWDTISDLSAKWIDSARSKDHARAVAAEQELRFFALAYASLPVDADIVTTGRKAILRSLYADLAGGDTGHVLAMLDRVIEREERMARLCAECETER